MFNIKNYTEDIFKIKSPSSFERLSIDAFRFQYTANPVYREYVDLCGLDFNKVNAVEKIPFLPIEFFKNQKIIVKGKKEQAVFLSSGTTGSVQSKHYVVDLNLYKQSFLKGFELFYGDIQEFVILALLPNYLERSGSSLVFMVEELIKQTESEHSGFYLYNHEELLDKIEFLQGINKRYY